MVIRHIQSLVQTYVEIEQRQFGRKLETAVSNLLTFMTHDGVDITNNVCKKVREVAVYRNVCGQRTE